MGFYEIETFFRRRFKRLKRSMAAPFKKSKTFKKLWHLMGPKGVLLYMAIQGRWNPKITFFLCLASLVGVYQTLIFILNAGFSFLGWVALVPMVLLSGYMHYTLWRCAQNMRGRFLAPLFRLYAAPMVAVLFFLILGILATGLHELYLFLAQQFPDSVVKPKQGMFSR